MKWSAKWIKPSVDIEDVCPTFLKNFTTSKKIKQAKLFVTALGVYEAFLNGKRVGDFVLAPGWTSYKKRLQYQEYDITDLLAENNELNISVGKGWCRSPLGWEGADFLQDFIDEPAAIIAQIEIIYEDGTHETITSDKSWNFTESNVRFSEIYDGETYDASFCTDTFYSVEIYEVEYDALIEQQGEKIVEKERLQAARIIKTPKGEVVIDFGQEITGYVEISVNAKSGDIIELSHAEVLDKHGNFYTENYRTAKAKFKYICKDGRQIYKPKFTFYGFRYIRVDEFPNGIDSAKLNNFNAIVVQSDIDRTGHLSCSNPLLNKLFDNIIWGQKCNFLDVPTDCPQRDERMGWTGDAQAFVKTAALNFDIEKFFEKWLADLAADQDEDGRVGYVIPELFDEGCSAAWSDAAVICPWEIYLAYGNPKILRSQFDSMKKWVNYITANTKKEYLWTGGDHFGDWLALDAKPDTCIGASRLDFIASAFYAYSTSLIIKAGKVLNEDISEFEKLYHNIVDAFRQEFTEYKTQTECVLAAHFNLAPNPQIAADRLAELIEECGVELRTGFVGTPYILHVLSNHDYLDLAYSLLLREAYPSWLYPVTKGATTVWEHWDGIKENGEFCDAEMNSFNHYAYGAVADWVYGVAAGIKPVEKHPGYERVTISPNPDSRLEWLNASLKTRHGLIRSKWEKQNDVWRYEIETPVDALVTIAGTKYEITKGVHIFYSKV